MCAGPDAELQQLSSGKFLSFQFLEVGCRSGLAGLCAWRAPAVGVLGAKGHGRPNPV